MTALPIEARRHPLVAEVRKRLVDRCEFSSGRLVVGVSGGADSLALLIALSAIRKQQSQPMHVEPIAVHVHHHLRDSADTDADHVAAVCEQLNVPHRQEHVNIDTSGNIAANAREARYAALRRVAIAEHSSTVAVAHHAEDQLETMLMALCRGAGPRGLAGMMWRRPMGEERSVVSDQQSAMRNQQSVEDDKPPTAEGRGDEFVLIRPMLNVRRADCADICQAAGMIWCEDPTNRDRTRARVRLRQDVLPVLEELWAGSAVRANVSAELLHEAAAALERELEATFGPLTQREWSRNALKSHRPAFLVAGLHRVVTHVHRARADESTDPTMTQMLRAAAAISDDVVKPRTFQLSVVVDLQITSRAVMLRS